MAEPALQPQLGAPACAGRRRGEALADAIFDAVIDQLRAVGYGGLTMEGVAAAARTGKAALYRRWASKDDLLADALAHRLPWVEEAPDSGSLRTDLSILLWRMATALNSPAGCAVQSLIGGSERDREVSRALRARIVEARSRIMIETLQQGVDRGEVRPDAVTSLVAAVGPALLIHRFLDSGPPIGRAVVDAIVDEVLLPMLRP